MNKLKVRNMEEIKDECPINVTPEFCSAGTCSVCQKNAKDATASDVEAIVNGRSDIRKHHNHNYKEGAILTDLEHREIFIFNDDRDGFMVTVNPDWVRRANEEEKQLLKNSGEDCVAY